MNLSKHQQIIVFALLALIGVGGSILYWLKTRSVEAAFVQPSANSVATAHTRPTEEILLIHVAGAVRQPGMYKLTKGSRVADAIQMAGGLTPNANEDKVNLAAKLKDGQQVHVLDKQEKQVQQTKQKKSVASQGTIPIEEMASSQVTATATADKRKNVASNTGKVNINVADKAELDRLPGIGPTLAQRILDYRSQNGSFARIEDIKQVKGITEKRFAALKDHITVD